MPPKGGWTGRQTGLGWSLAVLAVASASPCSVGEPPPPSHRPVGRTEGRAVERVTVCPCAAPGTQWAFRAPSRTWPQSGNPTPDGERSLHASLPGRGLTVGRAMLGWAVCKGTIPMPHCPERVPFRPDEASSSRYRQPDAGAHRSHAKALLCVPGHTPSPHGHW